MGRIWIKAIALIVIMALSSCLLASTERLFDVDAVNTDVTTLLRTLAIQSGDNIVIGQDVQAKVTAQLKQLPLPEILTYLTQSNGLGWQKNGDTYLVMKADALKAQDTPPAPAAPAIITAVWNCRYSLPTDLVAMTQKLFPDLTVTPGPDNATPTLDATAAAVTGSAVAGATANTADSKSMKPGSVVLRGTKDSVDEALALYQKVDVPRPQVLIQVIVSELSDAASRDLGLSWTWSPISLQESQPGSAIKFGTFSRAPINFEAVLAALDTDGKAKLLAKPSLAVVDGGRGSILIGDRILYPKLIGYSQLGTPLYDKDEEKVGVYLQIAPIVSDDGYITMTVYPQVSVVKSYLHTQAGDYPQISTREAKTTVRLRSGQQFAIGGLIQNNELDTMSKVPILGDLPFFGNLFRHRIRTLSKSEIVIFLVPTILPANPETAGAK